MRRPSVELHFSSGGEQQIPFQLAVDADEKALQLSLCQPLGDSAQERPHIRAFWGAAISTFVSTLGWFALAPLGLELAQSLGICENQMYAPVQHPTRRAYLKFKDLETDKAYCRYGSDDDENPSVCNLVPDDIVLATNADSAECVSKGFESGCLDVYAPSVLPNCLCTKGTECALVLNQGGVASASAAMLVHVVLGPLLARYGPVKVQAYMLVFCAVFLLASSLINAVWQYFIVRFLIGVLGSAFMTSRYWCSIMFTDSVVGRVSAVAKGWGSLGGGFTQIVMVIAVQRVFDDVMDMGSDVTWRIAMLLPAGLSLICAGCLLLWCWDHPRRQCYPTVAPHEMGAGWRDYLNALKDYRVLLVAFQMSACGGTEVAMNNQLSMHFRTYFQFTATTSALLAGSFSLLHLFAQPLGVALSDALNTQTGFRGRLWAQLLALVLEAALMFALGSLSQSTDWLAVLAVLLCLGLFAQMAQGTSFAIATAFNKQKLAVVATLMGIGTNIGAAIVGQVFYVPIEDELVPFQAHAAYIMLAAILCPLFYWKDYGGTLHGQRKSQMKDEDIAKGQMNMSAPCVLSMEGWRWDAEV